MTAADLAAWTARLRRHPAAVTLTLPGGLYRLDPCLGVDTTDRRVTVRGDGITLHVDPSTPVEAHR